MNPQESIWSRAACWLTFAAATSICFSIAAFYILMGMALAALIVSRGRWRLPRVAWPAGAFLLLTVVAWIASPDPWRDGFPQIKKFWVYGILLLVFSTFRGILLVRRMFLVWGVFACISALVGFVQFARKVQEARQSGVDFYQFYVAGRITGFTNHWNTYSGQEMLGLIMLVALLFFGIRPRRPWIWVAGAGLVAVALLLGETRSVWLATAVAGLYLLWFWKRWMVLLVPVAAAAIFLLSPAAIQKRFTSMLQPQQVDSNTFHSIARAAGVRMIEQHPLLGIGPDGPKFHFQEYVPRDVWASRPEGFYQHLHNVYLQYGADRGIPALLVFLWLLGQILFDFWRGLRALPEGRSDRRFLLHGGIAVVLALMAEGLFEVNFGDSEILAMFLIVVAGGYLALEKDVLDAA